MPPLIRVSVLDNAKADKCEGHCGLDFSSPETVEDVAGLLNQLYGETVKLEYLDIAEPSTSHAHPDIVARIKAENLPLPLLLINGKLRISGYFDIYLLQSAIQAEMEMGYE